MCFEENKKVDNLQLHCEKAHSFHAIVLIRKNLVTLALRTSVPHLLFLFKTIYFINYKNFPHTKGAKNSKN